LTVSNDRTFTIVLTVTYSPESTFDEAPVPVAIPDDMTAQLHSNVESCVQRENLLNDVDGMLEIDTWNLRVYEGDTVEAFRRGFNWASEHGWVDEDAEEEKP